MKCIDISTWQQNVNFTKVKASGVSAVIIRAGFGKESYQKDNRFEEHYKGASAVGLKIGAYWYSYAHSVAEAIQEAKACLACVKGKTFDLPIYFDMEEASQTKLGKATLTAMAKAFCDTIIAGGFRAGVYSNLNWLTNYLDYTALKTKYSIWLAQWSSSHSLSCDIWQYSATGSVNGISGNVDMNVIENTKVLTGGGTAVPTESVQTVTASVKFNYLAIKGYTNVIAQVKTLQRLLNANGVKGKDGKVLTVDGKFGTNTDYAVKAYQKAHGLKEDGIVGAHTWKSLLGAK